MRAVLALLLLLSLAGCLSSPAVHFYVLASPEGGEPSASDRAARRPSRGHHARGPAGVSPAPADGGAPRG